MIIVLVKLNFNHLKMKNYKINNNVFTVNKIVRFFEKIIYQSVIVMYIFFFL